MDKITSLLRPSPGARIRLLTPPRFPSFVQLISPTYSVHFQSNPVPFCTSQMLLRDSPRLHLHLHKISRSTWTLTHQSEC